MADAQLLQKYFVDSGKTKTYIAQKVGISRPRLDSILRSPDTATFYQAEILSAELSIKKDAKVRIFLP